MKRWVVLLLAIGCKSNTAPAPTPAAKGPSGSVLDDAFSSTATDSFASQLDKLRGLASNATPAERPLLDKIVKFAEWSAAHPTSYEEINHRYVAMVAEIVPALGKSDFKLALKLVASTNATWSSAHYHGDFELDAPVQKLETDLGVAFPDQALPQLLLARFMAESHLDARQGLAAAKHCVENVASVEPKFRVDIEKECRELHAALSTELTAPRCTVRTDLAFFRGGPRKSEIDPTVPVVVAGTTFYRQSKPFIDMSHATLAIETAPGSVYFPLDGRAATAAEDLRAGVRGEDDWIIVEAGGKPVLAGGWDLDGRLGVLGAGAQSKLEAVCTSAIERPTMPPALAL
ncbi:MAG TPA: hypothetical protein VGM39_00770 [Kofleriaceae bacterium]|jgi:hypothetical protein